MKIIPAQYLALLSSLSEVWKIYGGFRAFLGSPILHLSLVISLASFGRWKTGPWWESGIGVVPGILGFAIGTFAIFVAIGDEKFRSLIAKGGVERVNSVRSIYVSFVFLIIVQAVCIAYCLLAESRPLLSFFAFFNFEISRGNHLVLLFFNFLSLSFRFVGFTLVVYSLLSVIPMTLSVLRMGSLYLGSFLAPSKPSGAKPETGD